MLDFFSQKSQIAVQNITESMHKNCCKSGAVVIFNTANKKNSIASQLVKNEA